MALRGGGSYIIYFIGCVFPDINTGWRRQIKSSWLSRKEIHCCWFTCKTILQVLRSSLLLHVHMQSHSSETFNSLRLNDNNNKAKHESWQCLLVSSHYRTTYSLLEHAGSYADSTFLGDANAVKTTLSHRIKSHNSQSQIRTELSPHSSDFPLAS